MTPDEARAAREIGTLLGLGAVGLAAYLAVQAILGTGAGIVVLLLVVGSGLYAAGVEAAEGEL